MSENNHSRQTKIFAMGNSDKKVSVGHTSWSSGLERRIMTKINSIQQFLGCWRSYFLTQDFWSFSWLWTMLQMKISSLRIRFSVGQGAKKKLISWVGSRIPKPYLEKGFPACFQDGVVLCALVEKLSNGACPRYDVLDPEQKTRNLKLALYLVGKHLHFKPAVTAEQILQGGKLSERQLLLLLAHMKMASEKLKFFQNSGKALTSDPRNTPPSTFDSHRSCFARGMGLMLAVQGRRACFSVLISSTENMDMVIEIRGPKNTVCSKRITSFRSLSRGDSIDLCDTDIKNEILKKRIPLEYRILGNKISVNYTPLENGSHHMSIIWQGQHIPGSPYTINVDRSMDVPDQDIWCPRTERGVVQKRSESLSKGQSFEHSGDAHHLQSCDSKRRGKIIRKKILRYIVKVDGNDVVIDEPDQLCNVINNLKKITEGKDTETHEDEAPGSSKTPSSGSNALDYEQSKTCADTSATTTETMTNVDKILSKTTKSPIVDLYGLSTERNQASTFTDAQRQSENLQCANVESPAEFDSSRDTVRNANVLKSSNLNGASKNVNMIVSENIKSPIIDSNDSSTQALSTVSYPSVMEKQATNGQVLLDNKSTSMDSEKSVVKGTCAVKYSFNRTNSDCSKTKSTKLTPTVQKQMPLNTPIMTKSSSLEEVNKMVDKREIIEHSGMTNCNIKRNTCSESEVDSSFSHKEGTFFAKLVNTDIDTESSVIEYNGINLNENCSENITTDAIQESGILKSHEIKSSTVENRVMECSKQTFVKQLYNRNEESEDKVNETEVLPYIKDIIKTAGSLQTESDDSHLKHANLTAAKCNESSNVDDPKFESNIRNEMELNYDRKEVELKSRESHSFENINNNQNLKVEIKGSLIANSNFTKPENDVCSPMEFGNSTHLSNRQNDTKEQLDNKFNSEREKYLKNTLNEPSVCVDSIISNSNSSNANEASKSEMRSRKEVLKTYSKSDSEKDEISKTSIQESGWKDEISSKNVAAFSTNAYSSQGNEPQLDEDMYINSQSTDAMLRSNVSLFECDHSFPHCDTIDRDLYLLSNSMESQNNEDDYFVTNYPQHIESLSVNNRKDDWKISNRCEEVSSEDDFIFHDLSKETDYVMLEPDGSFHFNTDCDFEEMVFEIHQNDISRTERHSRKRTSWGDKTSLPSIRESSIEGIIDGDENITYLNNINQIHLDTDVIKERKDSLNRDSVIPMNSNPQLSAPTVYEARVVSVIDEQEQDKKRDTMKGDINQNHEAVSPVKTAHQNTGKASINLLCASPYGSKTDNFTREGFYNSGTAQRKYSNNSISCQTKCADEIQANKYKTEHAGDSSTFCHQEVVDGCSESTNQTYAGEITNEMINCEADQKLSQIPSVRKVIEIFQKEQAEPLDKWPEPESNAQKKSSRKIDFENNLECSSTSKVVSTEANHTKFTVNCGKESKNNSTSIFQTTVQNNSPRQNVLENNSEISKLTSNESNHINFAIHCGKEENETNSTSIKDRVRLFEKENLEQNHSLKMKHGVPKGPTASAILDKKRYWENFSH